MPLRLVDGRMEVVPSVRRGAGRRQAKPDAAMRSRALLDSGQPLRARDVATGALGRGFFDPDLRSVLAESCLALGQPVEAGKHALLTDADSPELTAARAAFEAACGDRAWTVITTLGLHRRSPAAPLPEPVADRLRLLSIRAATEGYGWTLDSARDRTRQHRPAQVEAQAQVLGTTRLIIALLVTVWCVGFITLWRWLFAALRG